MTADAVEECSSRAGTVMLADGRSLSILTAGFPTAAGDPPATTLSSAVMPSPGGASSSATAPHSGAVPAPGDAQPRGGGDLIVLEAGLGGGGGSWGHVLRGLAAAGAVAVAYDRAGYGDSTPMPGPRPLNALADDLDELLALLEEEHRPGRIVVVAHSWGGPVARIVADRRRRAGRPLDGLVLVDPSDEKAQYFFGPLLRTLDRAQAALAPVGSRLGLFTPLSRLTYRSLPEPERSAAVHALVVPGAGRTMAAEIRPILSGLWTLLRHPVDVGPTPLVIISAQRAAPFEGAARRHLLEAHRRTAAEAEDGRVVVAEHSGHLVMLSEPDVIVDQVLRVLGR